MPLDKENAPTISELIGRLEELQDEHGDLPVVYLDRMWHSFPDPSIEEGREYGVTEGDEYIEDERVEL